MKRLLLLLIIVTNAAAMEQNHQNYAGSSLQEISQEATQLHEFLTENLDNTDEALSDAAVSRVAGKLKELNVNPAILLELKDKRSKQVYDFGLYLKKNKNKQLVIIAKNPRCLPLSSRTAANGSYTLLADSLQIATINVCQSSNNNDLLQNRAVTESFDLVNNGEQRNGNASYSLMHLLLRCKRPGALVTILNESPYMPFLPDTGLLKSYCENSSTDWRKVTQIIDDGCELAAATEHLIRAKKFLLNNVPTALMVAYTAPRVKNDLKNLSLASYAAIKNPSGAMVSCDLGLIKFAFSGLDEWFDNMEISLGSFSPLVNNLIDSETGHLAEWRSPASAGCIKIWSGVTRRSDGRGVDVKYSANDIPVFRYFAAYCTHNKVKDLWTQLVDKVNDRLQIDQKISNLLARKVMAKTLVSASKAVQKALPESVKKYVGGKLVRNTMQKKAIAPSHDPDDVYLDAILVDKVAIEKAKAEQAQHQQQSSSCTIV